MYKRLGILGGMGPLATYELYKNIIKSTPAQKDQDHIDMTILNASYIPDRTAGILYGGESPLPYLLDGCKRLENDGCDIIAMPCNTSHYFYDELQNNCGVRILNMIELTAERCENLGVESVYIMATAGTIKTDVYQKCLSARNIAVITPTENEIEEMMRVIYDIKASNTPDTSRLEEISWQHKRLTILGCTELSTLSELRFKNNPHIKIIDAMDVLKDTILELFGIK